jgi:hypothetical protein
VACIKLEFPRVGYTTSTWVADEYWEPLSTQQRTALIARFVKNHHPKLLHDSMSTTGRKSLPNFRWSEI